MSTPRITTRRGRLRANAVRMPAPLLGTGLPVGRTQLKAGQPRLVDRTLLRYGVRPLLISTDLAAVVLAAVVAGTIGQPTVLVAALLLGLHTRRHLHRGCLTLSILDDGPALVARSLAATGLVVALGVLIKSPSLTDQALFLALALQVPFLLFLRALAYALVRAVRTRRVVEHPTLVLGAGRIAGQLTSLLLEHPEYGLLPIGMLDDDPLLDEHERPVPLLGGVDALAKVLVEFRVRNVVVAFGSSPESSLIDVIRTCDRLDCEVFSVPRLFETHSTTREMESVWGIPLVRLKRAAFRRPVWRLKRLLDIAVSAVALILLSPLLAAVALAVRLDSGKGFLFRQTRIGMDGRPFEVLKFRSLRPVVEGEEATTWNISNDHRLGKVGKVLRSSSMDELPQLWNILRGDMTLVGPRPERPHFVEEFSRSHTRYISRHRVPAGLTGWAQIHGLRGDTSIEDRARFDNYYIENWTLWGDIKIILRTVSAVLLLRGS